MKNNIFYSLALLLILSACKEEPPNIVFKDPNVSDFDTTYVVQNVPVAPEHTVLIEDFTGVRCTNCPSAHDEIAAMIQAHPGKIVALALHPAASPLTVPYPGYADFRLNEVKDLSDNLGGYNGLPAGAVDRIYQPGQNYLLVSNYTLWSGFLNPRLGKTCPYQLVIKNTLNNSNDSLLTELTVTLTAAVQDTLSLTAVITENKVISPQENPMREVDTFYEHNHLVRKFITPATGKSLVLPSKEPGRVFRYTARRKLDPTWKPENCTVAAFIHSGGARKEVFQAAEKKFK
jgi:hypothetical protein